MVTKINEKLDAESSKIEELNTENIKMKGKIDELSKHNQVLQLEQYIRKNNTVPIIINGISYRNEENILELVVYVAKALNVTLYEYNINTAHRVLAN